MRLLLAMLFLAVPALACDKGCYEYRGECACDIAPITAPTVKPSDEIPPTDKMPSYQREGIKVIEVPNMAAEDAKYDQDKLDADKEGKKAAGIKPKITKEKSNETD